MSTVESIKNKRDIEKVKQLLAKQSKRNLLLFAIGINCGLKISDILNLIVGDVRNKVYIQIVAKREASLKNFRLIQN